LTFILSNIDEQIYINFFKSEMKFLQELFKVPYILGSFLKQWKSGLHYFDYGETN